MSLLGSLISPLVAHITRTMRRLGRNTASSVTTVRRLSLCLACYVASDVATVVMVALIPSLARLPQFALMLANAPINNFFLIFSFNDWRLRLAPFLHLRSAQPSSSVPASHPAKAGTDRGSSSSLAKSNRLATVTTTTTGAATLDTSV